MRIGQDSGIKHEALFADHKHGYNCSLAVVVYYPSVGLDHLVPVLINDYVRPAVFLRYDIVVDTPIKRNLGHDIQAVCLHSVEEIVIDLIVVPKPWQIGAFGLIRHYLPGAVRV